MPFTAAHPLAVLPLVRRHRRLGLDPTCLVIGSMAPDRYRRHGCRGARLGAPRKRDPVCTRAAASAFDREQRRAWNPCWRTEL